MQYITKVLLNIKNIFPNYLFSLSLFCFMTFTDQRQKKKEISGQFFQVILSMKEINLSLLLRSV